MKENIKSNLIAVYGTLRYGCGNHGWHIGRENKPLSIESIPGWEMCRLGGFPGCRPSADTNRSIVVELYMVDDKILSSINSLEGYSDHPGAHNTFYDRTTVSTSMGDAYIYVYQGNFNPSAMIESGDWLLRRETVLQNKLLV